MSVANRKRCPGYTPYGCQTLIDPAKDLCQFCTRTKVLEVEREAAEAAIESKRRAFLKQVEIVQANREKPDLTPRPIFGKADETVPTTPRQAVHVTRPVFGQPADTWHPVVEVIEVMEPELVPSCPCGGMRDGQDHEDSLLHRQYLLSQKERPTAHYRTHWPKGANQ